MLIELSILIPTQSVEFFLLWDVVCGVHITEILLFLVFLFSLLDELCNFCLHLFPKFWVRFVRGHGKLDSVFAFQQFKLLLLCPL